MIGAQQQSTLIGQQHHDGDGRSSMDTMEEGISHEENDGGGGGSGGGTDPPPALPPSSTPSVPMPTNQSTSSSSSSSFNFSSNQFSAANLFGLFERIANRAGIETNNFNNTMPENVNSLKTGEETSASSLALTATNQLSEVNIQQSPPIDKLLQISQQLLNGSDGMGTASKQKQHQQQRRNNGGRGGGGGGTTPTENGGEENTTGGGRSAGGNDRKRSYPYTFQFCVLCQKNVHSSKLPCHIRQCHVGKPMFQCPVCDFTSTYSKNNVKSHMVSLHGLAGDPISYMDQYASQVEEFMKQCFPNVRGRGRPLHGRLSPSAKQQLTSLAMSPARITTSTVLRSHSGSNNSSADLLSSASPAGPSSSILMTPPQQRRHSSSTTTDKPATSNSAPSHQRGRQQRTAMFARMADNVEVEEGIGVVGRAQLCSNVNGGGGDDAEGVLSPLLNANNDVYGAAIGMLTGQAMLQRGGVPSLPTASTNLNSLNKGAMSFHTGFPSAFNPFVYLQHLNNLFTANNSCPSAPFPVDSLPINEPNDSFMPKIQMDMAMDEKEQEQQSNQTLFSLEECLNLSQKFLKEMNKEEPNMVAVQNDAKSEIAKDMLACHSSSTASPPSSACFPVAVNSCSSINDFHENEPRYFPQLLPLAILDGPQIEKTVFNTFTNSNELIEKFDLAIFESLLEQNSGSLLTDSQRQTVASVRKQLGLQSFEIMFAVHRLDINVLKPENVHLVMRIAPTELDIRRFQFFEQSNPSNSLDDDEQFVVQLSKIDRLREKIAVMAMMGEFDERMTQLNQQLLNYSLAAKLLYNSAEFHTLLHLLLACANLINGDFTAQLIRGFRPHHLPEMCSFRFPSGITLLEMLSQILRKHFTSELDTFAVRCKVVEEAAKVEFEQFHRELRYLQEGQFMVEEELQLSDGKNRQLANFLTHCELECAHLKESIQSTKNQLISTMEFFGEFNDRLDGVDQLQHHQFRPERFFAVISQFVCDLRVAIGAIGKRNNVL